MKCDFAVLVERMEQKAFSDFCRFRLESLSRSLRTVRLPRIELHRLSLNALNMIFRKVLSDTEHESKFRVRLIVLSKLRPNHPYQILLQHHPKVCSKQSFCREVKSD